MQLIPSVLCAAILAGAALEAQTPVPAQALTRVPCGAPAPAHSLVPGPLSAPILVKNGFDVVAVEIESQPPTDSWTWVSDSSGHTGSAYYRWDGPDLFGTPGIGILTYDLQVEVEGVYTLVIRNRHVHPDPTLENDCFVRVDGGAWHKLFSNIAATLGQWTFESTLEGIGPAQYYLTPGLHRVEISGRSHGFMIDRLHVFGSSASWPLSPDQALSELKTSVPALGQVFEARMDDPQDQAKLTPGASWTFWLANEPLAGYPCGVPVAGFGPAGAQGEWFISLGPGLLLLAPPRIWTGPGSPVNFQLPVPTNPALVGKALPTQGVFVDAAPGAISPFVLTEGLELVFGDF